MQIHQSAEDYLETILMLNQRMGRVRSIDVVNELGYTKASVSIAMKKLRENGYIAVDGEGNLAPVSCLAPGAAPCERMANCRTYNMWKGLNDLITNYFGNITIADLAAPEEAGNDYVI